MSPVAQLLFSAGTVLLVVAFAAHVGHAVLLANGRRVAAATAAAAALAPRPAGAQPAWAGIASGSFVRARAAAESAGPAPSAVGTGLSGIAQWLTVAAFAALLVSATLRGVVVGRGPWGNLFEFSVAFATSIVGGYLVLSRRYPIASIAAIPLGVAVFLALYAASLALSQRAFIAMTGQPSDLSLALAVLVLASTFTPIKQRLQDVVDRRFRAQAEPQASLRDLQRRVQAVAAVVDRNQLLRQLLAGSRSGRHYGEDELGLVEEVGLDVARAVELFREFPGLGA